MGAILRKLLCPLVILNTLTMSSDNTTLDIAALSQGNNTLEAVAMSSGTLDTLAMAREERQIQGSFEVEISYEGEEGLQKYQRDCQKNPGHQDFVPAHEFNMDHLPPGYKDDDLVNLVKAMSNLTVRLSVNYVSKNRPATFPGTSKPYPANENRGNRATMFGTGSVVFVVFKDTARASILIMTSRHVVFDDDEGAHTTCHLFFDRGNINPKSCSGVVTLNEGSFARNHKVASIDFTVDGSDFCLITFETPDLELARRLKKLIDDSRILEETLNKKYVYTPREKQKNTLKAGRGKPLIHTDYSLLADPKEPLTIIVSHPHGFSKQISVGFCVSNEVTTNGALDQFKYTTPTCPGSSGASVFVLTRLSRALMHSGGVDEKNSNEKNSKLNFGEMNTSF